MRDFWVALAGTVGGAVLGVVLVFAAAGHGLLPGGGTSGTQIRGYLMTHPELVAEMTDKLQTQQQDDQDKAAAAAIKKVGMAAFFDPSIAFVSGPADAKTSLVEFYDYDCPYCRASLPAVMKFYEAHKADTRFSFIEFPIPQLHGPGAVLAAKVSLAARKQPEKYMALHFILMSKEGSLSAQDIYDACAKAGLNMAKLQADMNDPQIDKVLAASHDLAKKVGIDGTPTFIVNGVMHPGAVDEDTLNGLIKES